MNKKIHWSFWAISIFMLIWNVFGTVNLLWQLSAGAEELATLPKTHQAIFIGRPLWATVGFALGVILGSLGCVLLLLKIRYSFHLFVVSFVGIVLTMVHTINTAKATTFTAAEFFVMIVLPMLVAVFLILYSKWINKRN